MFGGLVGSTSSHVQTSMENIVFFVFFILFSWFCVCVFLISLSFVSIRQGLCMDNKKNNIASDHAIYLQGKQLVASALANSLSG